MRDIVQAGKSQPGVLQPLGLGADEERAYEALLDHPGANRTELAALAGLPKRQLDTLIAGLEEKGLLSRSPTTPPRFFLAAPEAAIEALILQREEAFRAARAHSRQLQARFLSAYQRDTSAVELIEVVTGVHAIAQRFRQLRESTQHEQLSFNKPPFAVSLPESQEATLSSLRRGQQIRAIYDPETLEIPGVLDEIEVCAAAGQQTRLNPVPMKLFIIDRRVALVPLRAGGAAGDSMLEGAIIVHASPLLQALTQLFELLWAGASAVPTAPAGDEPSMPLDGTDRNILTLLSAGHTDESIARALNLGDRTVGRRIGLMMRALGVQTRFQLGQQGTRQGWMG